jgi:AcrR family transcriptional regulator
MTDAIEQQLDSMRKKPTQPRAWRTVATIFEATAQILNRYGEQALTTNRVAERAGVSIGTLYQYFPGMDAIILAMIDWRRRQIVGELEKLLAAAGASDDDPAVHTRLYIRALIEAFGIPAPGLAPLLRKAWLLDHTPECIAMMQETVALTHASLTRRAHPDYPPPSPADLFVVTRGVMGAIRAAVLEGSDLPGTQAFEDALTAMTLAITRRPSAGAGAATSPDAHSGRRSGS